MTDLKPVEGTRIDIPGDATATGLQLPEDLSFEEWSDCGTGLRRLDGAVKWWVGDWLIFGEERFPERWSQAVEMTEYDQETLRKAAWVAASVPRGTRRETLPYRHHEIVASLPSEEQEKWLNACEPEYPGAAPRLTSRELTEEIKGGEKKETVDIGTCPHCGAIFDVRQADLRTERS